MGLGIVFPGQGARVEGVPTERTRDAQLAVLTASLSAWERVRHDVDASCFAGHSLGQVTALIAAGVLSVEDGMRFAVERAEATQAAADRRPGRMAAVLGADDADVDAACAAAPGACWRANENAPGQVVIAGTPAGVAAASAAVRTGKVVPLAVDGAFHTPLMQPAVDALRPTLAALPVRRGRAPVVSNGDGLPHEDGDGWRARLAAHLVEPVQWRTSLETMAKLGVDGLLAVGPDGGLAGMARRTVPALPVEVAR